MNEQIEQHLHDIKAQEMVTLIDDGSFFAPEAVKGLTFQVRRSNFLSSSRTLNIIDEVEEKMKQLQVQQEAEAKRDMTYEEYLEKY